MSGFIPPSDGSSSDCPLCGSPADNAGGNRYSCPECGNTFCEGES